MCIIAVKKSGVAMPNEATIRTMFQKNPDGAGFMLKQKGGDEIMLRKGFMKIGEFLRAIRKLKIQKDDLFVMHFRIETSGGVTKGLCHPFVISDSDEMLRLTTLTTKRICFAHNGIISQLSYTNREKGCSDTSLFARDYLSDDAIYYNIFTSTAVQMFIDDFIGMDRMVFIHPDDDNILMFGSWEDDGGMKYSNTAYKEYEYIDVFGFDYTSKYKSWDECAGKNTTKSRVGGVKSVMGGNGRSLATRDYTNDNDSFNDKMGNSNGVTICDYCKEWDACTWVGAVHAWVCPTCMGDTKEIKPSNGTSISVTEKNGTIYTKTIKDGITVVKTEAKKKITPLVVVEDDDGINNRD